MKNLEQMERVTPEFEELSPVDKLMRRRILAQSLEDVVLRRNTGSVDERSAMRMTSELLELHLTGKVESIPVEKQNP